MSKKILLCLTGVFATLVIFSCAGKKHASEHEHGADAASADASEWKQMDDFHIIMAETFHPFKDSANLEPAKTRAAELLRAADEWVAAGLPAKVDNEVVRSKLRQLKAEAETLVESVQSSEDNVIAERLTKLHDTFHSIQEAWYD